MRELVHVDHPHRLGHPELDVQDSYLTERGVRMLQGVCREVAADNQRDDQGDPSNRYASAVE